MYHIGVISDTHGLLREETTSALQGCDAILHAGDVDQANILEKLQEIGPLYVVHGNADCEWAEDVPKYLETELFGIRICMVHNKKDLPKNLGNANLVVFGHSHKYLEETKGGICFLNPGSCGPKRFRLPITMAIVDVDEKEICNIRRIDITPEETQGKTEISKKAKGKAKTKVSEKSEGRSKMPEAEQDRRKLVKAVMRDVDKGRSVEQIAEIHHINIKLAEQICRMYLTHPGVNIDGILNRIS